MIQSHKFLFPKTAHYYTLGEANQKVKYFWIVCHGYGQLASKIIRKFEAIQNEETFIIAPEGLSRFYWNNLTNQVGASWMTKDDRLDEIEDYSRYLQQLYDQYVPQFSKDVKIILFGFSQGCATQCRWILNKLPKYHQLILWAGLLPEDLDYQPHQSYFANKKLLFVCGDEDQFLTETTITEHSHFARNQLLEMDQIIFEGKHQVKREILSHLVKTKIMDD